MANFTIKQGDGQIEFTDSMTAGDAAWILSNSFLILTMQTGFGMLEAGCVSAKNIANIMVKNVVDVTLGGLTYWSLGYGLSFGEPHNFFCGFGDFFFQTHNESAMGELYTHYVFQFSFATAATTIVSGAVAERMRLSAYMMFSVYNTFVYCFPASWVWSENGFLAQLGFHDFAGACVVHVTGGASALVATIMLGPRIGRFSNTDNYTMSSPVTALTGTFMLWWAWLAFNCGSTFGLEKGKWKIAAKVAVNTLNGSISGGLIGLLGSAIVFRKERFDITYIITSVLGGLVGVTAACGVINPVESLFVGAIGATTALAVMNLLEKVRIDDPVGAVPVHFGAGIVSTICVGLFGHDAFKILDGNEGLFISGKFYLIGIQLLGLVIIIIWSTSTTALGFLLIDKLIGIRVGQEEEILGADFVEHNIKAGGFTGKLEKAISQLHFKDDQLDQLIRKLFVELAVTEQDQNNPGTSRNGASVAPSEGVKALVAALLNVDLEQKSSAHLRCIPHSIGLPIMHIRQSDIPGTGTTDIPGTVTDE